MSYLEKSNKINVLGQTTLWNYPYLTNQRFIYSGQTWVKCLMTTDPGEMSSSRCPTPHTQSSGSLTNNIQARIVSIDTGEDVGEGEAGELLIRGPQVEHCTILVTTV